MTALHSTRRQLLGCVATALATAAAGCAGESSSETTVESNDPRDGPPPGATTEFEVETVRAPVEEPFVRIDDEQNRAGGHGAYLFVLDEGDAAQLRFDANLDDVDRDDAGLDESDEPAIRSFVEATAFEEESVVVVQRRIGDCYERRVEYVELGSERFRVRFCRVLKDATTPCEADVDMMQALFLRVPQPYEDPPSRRGSGESSRCQSDFWDEGDRP